MTEVPQLGQNFIFTQFPELEVRSKVFIKPSVTSTSSLAKRAATENALPVLR
jgi:hypothetical protein